MKNYFKKNGELKKWSVAQAEEYVRIRDKPAMTKEEHKFYTAFYTRKEKLETACKKILVPMAFTNPKENLLSRMPDAVNHPAHYGGKDDPFEAIKVIEAWKLGFNLGNTVKYIARAGKKDPAKTVQDLEKAKFYLEREIALLKR